MSDALFAVACIEAFVAFVLLVWTLEVAQHKPWDALSRAKRARRRLVCERAVELVARGYTADSAMNTASYELERDAREQTNTLKAEGVE